MKKTIKIAIDQSGRGVFLVIETKEEAREAETTDHRKIKSFKVLSISGFARQRIGADYAYCGQIYDELNDKNIRRWLLPKENIKGLVTIWKRWHLNGLNSGCIHQKAGDYTNPKIAGQVCPKTGYKYGTAWLVEELPQGLEEKIEQLTA